MSENFWNDELVGEYASLFMDETREVFNDLAAGKPPKKFTSAGEFRLKKEELRYLKSIPKSTKQKLFTTEDGKDIYEGDEYWILFIESGSRWIPSKTKASEHTIADVTKSYRKRFSTEELAKEYAIMHKPCLSLDDLLSAWGGGDGKSKEYYANAPLFLSFKKLVNEKLNAINR